MRYLFYFFVDSIEYRAQRVYRHLEDENPTDLGNEKYPNIKENKKKTNNSIDPVLSHF